MFNSAYCHCNVLLCCSSVVLNCCRQYTYTVPGGGGCMDTQIELYGPPVSSVPLQVLYVFERGQAKTQNKLSWVVLQTQVFLCECEKY